MQVNAVFSLYEREKRQVEWIYKQARTGQVWLKGFPFSQPGFYMRSDISFYAFFFFFVLVSFLFIARIEREMRILHTREGLSKGWTDGRVHIC